MTIGADPESYPDHAAEPGIQNGIGNVRSLDPSTDQAGYAFPAAAVTIALTARTVAVTDPTSTGTRPRPIRRSRHGSRADIR